MTTAPATNQDTPVLYGPDGQALTRSTTPQAPAAKRADTAAGEWKPVAHDDTTTVWEKPALARKTTPDAPKAHEPAPSPRPQPSPEQAAPAKPKPTKPAKSLFDRVGPWIALWAAVGLTASGEYELAHLVGFPLAVAALLPIAIDIYVIQAFRRHRDVAAALVLMVLTNAVYHLADAGLFGVATRRGPGGAATHQPLWWLIVGVSAIPPFIVWRVHRITEKKPETAPAKTAATRSATPSGASVQRTSATPPPVADVRETAVAASRETTPATPSQPVSAPPATRPATGAATTPGRPAATPETAPGQRETTSATRRATAPRKAAAKVPATAKGPATLTPRATQMEIVGRFIDAWDGSEKDLPLQPIAEALGCSKSTASRRVAEYRAAATKTA